METYNGYMETALDALLLLEGCRVGVLKFVTKRLDEVERTNIRSGQIFVWDEEASGIQRWTDGRRWSSSRPRGNFIIYRELCEDSEIDELKQATAASSSPDLPSDDSKSPTTPDSSDSATVDGIQSRSSSSGSSISSNLGPGVLTSAGIRVPAKPNGLIKRALSITISDGRRYHLVSYYMAKDLEKGRLAVPRFDDRLRNLQLADGVYPALTREVGQDGVEAWRFAASQGRGHASALPSDMAPSSASQSTNAATAAALSTSTSTSTGNGIHGAGFGAVSKQRLSTAAIPSGNDHHYHHHHHHNQHQHHPSMATNKSAVNCFRIQPNGAASSYAPIPTHGSHQHVATSHASDHFYHRRYSLQHQQSHPTLHHSGYSTHALDRAVYSSPMLARTGPHAPPARVLSRTVSASSIPVRSDNMQPPSLSPSSSSSSSSSSVQLPSLSTLLADTPPTSTAASVAAASVASDASTLSYAIHRKQSIHDVSSSSYESNNRYPTKSHTLPTLPLLNGGQSASAYWSNSSSMMETDCADCQMHQHQHQHQHQLLEEHEFHDDSNHNVDNESSPVNATQAPPPPLSVSLSSPSLLTSAAAATAATTTVVDYMNSSNGGRPMMESMPPSSLRFYRPRSASTPHLFHHSLRRKSSLSTPHPGYFHMGHGSGPSMLSPHSPRSPRSPHHYAGMNGSSTTAQRSPLSATTPHGGQFTNNYDEVNGHTPLSPNERLHHPIPGSTSSIPVDSHIRTSMVMTTNGPVNATTKVYRHTSPTRRSHPYWMATPPSADSTPKNEMMNMRVVTDWSNTTTNTTTNSSNNTSSNGIINTAPLLPPMAMTRRDSAPTMARWKSTTVFQPPISPRFQLSSHRNYP